MIIFKALFTIVINIMGIFYTANLIYLLGYLLISKYIPVSNKIKYGYILTILLYFWSDLNMKGLLIVIGYLLIRDMILFKDKEESKTLKMTESEYEALVVPVIKEYGEFSAENLSDYIFVGEGKRYKDMKSNVARNLNLEILKRIKAEKC